MFHKNYAQLGAISKNNISVSQNLEYSNKHRHVGQMRQGQGRGLDIGAGQQDVEPRSVRKTAIMRPYFGSLQSSESFSTSTLNDSSDCSNMLHGALG